MLAHLQYVGLPLLLIYLNRFHVSLPNHFYGNSLASQHMSGTSYLTELSLSERMFEPIKIFDILLMRPILDEQRPFDLLILTSEMESQSLLRRQYDLKWPICLILLLNDRRLLY